MDTNLRRCLHIALPVGLLLWALLFLACTAHADESIPYQGPHGFAVAFKPLSTESAITEVLWQAENIVDIQQTLKIAREPQNYHEVGTLSIFAGDHPTVRQVYVVSIAFGIAHYAVTRAIENLVDANPDYRVLQRVWSYGTLGAKTWNIQRNAHIGLGY
jgi:hypothetical protein